MKVHMTPSLRAVQSEESGVRRVIEAYHRYLPAHGIKFVADPDKADLRVAHIGTKLPKLDVLHLHGLYWTADYFGANWEWHANAAIINAIQKTDRITVPSDWVAETFKRDLRVTPKIVPHGLDLQEWGDLESSEGYVLWNKNRTGDVCDPAPVKELAERFPRTLFVTTFAPPDSPPNVKEIGVVPHDDMKEIVKKCAVYLSTTKETFGIGILEAMASARPTLAFREGGAAQLVRHAETGYLANPNQFDDLAQGLEYCLEHLETLGQNSRERVKSYTWEAVAADLADYYRDKPKKSPGVTVIIPCYNYADQVSRAIESVLSQTHQPKEIIVVDDGSEDADELQQVIEKYKGVRLIQQENQGVAIARNTGIAAAKTDLVCCLDADDAIAPDFLELCVPEFYDDPSLGIAYTGLHWVKPDGSEGDSEWPGEWNYDAQLERKNQVPTCCVFRKEMWRRLGGYRQRYAPKGAGSEDADFWTRAGAYGWRAKKVTAASLFIYSWMSGATSKPDYQEVDWLGWHPWVKDKEHPFASFASTGRRPSHPVRQYDDPAISVIIPVGPGHEKVLIDALDSLEAQTFRRWEAIVVLDGTYENGTYSTEDQFMPDEHLAMKAAYPYVRWLVRSTGPDRKPAGAGWARNFGASYARAPFLVFLDADDYLRPTALQRFLDAWQEVPAIVYSDYLGEAFVDDPEELSDDLKTNIRFRDEKTKRTIMGYKAANYDCERAVRQPESPIYLWANVTCLIPKRWHDEISGFDERMKTWEDVDYHYRMARAGRCYIRIEEELLFYRYHSGTRRQFGFEKHKQVITYLEDKYKEIDSMGCSGCPKTMKKTTQKQVTAARTAFRRQEAQAMSDGDFVRARYLSQNQGMHGVKGGATGNNYGYRKGGDVFLVHKSDLASQPHLFEEIREEMPAFGVQTPPPPPEIAEANAAYAEQISETVEELAEPEQKLIALLPHITKEIEDQLYLRKWASNEILRELDAESFEELKGIGKKRAAEWVEFIKENS